jgi:hypothetical protein
MEQRNPLNTVKEAMRNKNEESVKTEQSVKMNFPEALKAPFVWALDSEILLSILISENQL